MNPIGVSGLWWTFGQTANTRSAIARPPNKIAEQSPLTEEDGLLVPCPKHLGRIGAVVRPEQIESLGIGTPSYTRLAPVDRPGDLAWDHPQIVKLAKNYVRSRYESEPDPEQILGPASRSVSSSRFTRRSSAERWTDSRSGGQ